MAPNRITKNDPDIKNAQIPEQHQLDNPLHDQIRVRLLSLSYRAFLQAVVHLLSAQGYARVAPVGRNGFKGRNRAGGWDLEAHDYIDGDCRRCIVQVKQFGAQAIYQRHVDELRGGLLRAEAHEALLVTLAAVSPQARRAALAGGELAPVRLTDGDELAEQMAEHRIGICRVRGQWGVNALYFESLEKRFGSESQARTENRASLENREAGEDLPAENISAETTSAGGGAAMPPSKPRTASIAGIPETPERELVPKRDRAGTGPITLLRLTIVIRP